MQTVLERGETEGWFDTRYIVYLTVAIKGITGADAQDRALKLLAGTITRQSNALSFGDAYLLIVSLFLPVLPLLLLAGRKRSPVKSAVLLSDHWIVVPSRPVFSSPIYRS